MLVSRSRLVEDNAVEVLHYYGFHLSSSFSYDVKFQVHLEEIIMWKSSRFLSKSSCRWATCGSSAFKHPILSSKSCHNLYPFIRSPGRPFAFGIGRILIQGFIRTPPRLPVNDAVHSLPLGGVSKGFPFTEDETRRHFL